MYFLTDLVEHTLDVPVKESYSEHINHLMTIVIDNTEVKKDILISEVGIFARLLDAKTGEEVLSEALYGYTYTYKYDYLPAPVQPAPYYIHREIIFNTVLSREGKFEIIFDMNQVYATIKDLEGVKKEFSLNIEKLIQKLEDAFEEHINDNVRHITSAERAAWNAKADRTGVTGALSSLESAINTTNNKIGANNDAAGTNTLFARLKQIYDYLTANMSSSRMIKIDNLDATISSRATQTSVSTLTTNVGTVNTNINTTNTRIGASGDTANASGTTLFALIKRLTTDWTTSRAGKLDNLDATISSRAAANTALSNATWTNARAGYLDKLNQGVFLTGSVIKSIQRFSLDVWGTMNVTIAPVNVGKTIIVRGSVHLDGSRNASYASIGLTSSTQVTINGASASYAVYAVKFQVVEFY